MNCLKLLEFTGINGFRNGILNKGTRSLSRWRKSIFKGTMFRYSTESHRGNIKSYFLKNASLPPALADSPPALAGY
jgi:hypothetical protein